MDRETNKRYSIWILIAFVLIGAFIIAWGLFLNKGSLIIKAAPPFEITILAGPNEECNENECKYELKPGAYEIAITKDNYFEYKNTVEVERWAESLHEPKLRYIPHIESIAQKGHTTVSAKSQAIKKSLPVSTVAFNFSLGEDAEDTYAYLAEDLEQNKQALFLHTPNGNQVLTYFPRPLKAAQISFSADDNKLAVFEQNAVENHIYSIDIAKAKKDQVTSFAKNIKGLKWSPDNRHLLVVLGDKEVAEVHVLSLDGSKKTLPFKEEVQFFDWLDDNNLIIATSNLLVTADDSEGFSAEDLIGLSNDFNIVVEDGEIKDVLEEDITEDLTEEIAKERVTHFYSYNLLSEASEKIAFLDANAAKAVNVEVRDLDAGRKVYFLDEDQVLHKIVMEEE